MGRRRAMIRLLGVVALTAVVSLAAPPAWAHEERHTHAPDGSYHVPEYREADAPLLVCTGTAAEFESRIAGFPPELLERNRALWAQCTLEGVRHLQEAVDRAPQIGGSILVLPGTYTEEPSLADPVGECAAIDAPWSKYGRYQVLSYEQQAQCPHVQNLVGIFGKRDLQIEGTGARPEDVVVDAQFRKLNAIRADRANGIYLRNLTAQRTTFNAVYIMETDGFVIDRVVGRWNTEYGFLTFANDHGLYTDCEAYGNGDSGVYPGANSDLNRDRGDDVVRYAVEIRGCHSHHNLLGYSGTAGNSVWAHDNTFTENTTGVATDSAFPDHPGLPQNHALFERNVIADNNQDYYRHVRDGTCARPPAEQGIEDGVVCPAVGVPVGAGVLNPGGNHNIWRENWVYGNEHAGFVTTWVPGIVRNDAAIAAQFDTSHHNRYYANALGRAPDGEPRPNGLDFWWDGQGVGSCWQEASGSGSEPLTTPRCDADGFVAGPGSHRLLSEPVKSLKLLACLGYSLPDAVVPDNCDWYGARGWERVEVQIALGEALLLGIPLIALWARRLRPTRVATAAVAMTVTGLTIGVFGAAHEATALTPLGLALVGAGLLGVGVTLRRTTRLGTLTIALAVFALLGAVDRGLVMLPWTPVGPVWVRILLELCWVPWAVLLVVRHRRAPREAEAAVG